MAVFTGISKLLGGTERVLPKEQYYYGLVQQHVLVTGGEGQLGSALKMLSERMSLPFRFVFTDAAELDITRREQVEAFVADHGIRYIINCAGYTAVDKAESEQEKVYAVNAAGAENIALVAKKYGAKMLHVSTDYVFSGEATEPYREESPTGPLSVYGATKLKGEQLVQAAGGAWIILRTAWLFSEFGSNFVKTMLRLMEERDRLTVVDDRRGSPTYAVDLAEMMIHILLLANKGEWKTGLYHFTNGGQTTWYGFASAIKKLAGMEHCEVLPITSDQYPLVAKRPAYSVLDSSKACNTFGVKIPAWEEALQRCIRQIIHLEK